MKIVISEIPDDGLSLELSDNLESDAVKILSPVDAKLRLDRIDRDLVANGSLCGVVELECARCLKAFEYKIVSKFSIMYHPAERFGRHEQHELKSDELDTVFYTGDVLETDDLLKDQLLLNLPMKPLCSPDCRGFCPRCGADRNIKPCDCGSEEGDIRFEALKRFRIEKE